MNQDPCVSPFKYSFLNDLIWLLNQPRQKLGKTFITVSATNFNAVNFMSSNQAECVLPINEKLLNYAKRFYDIYFDKAYLFFRVRISCFHEFGKFDIIYEMQ